MNNRTRIVLIVSLVYFIAVASVLGCVVYLIHQQGTRLDESQIAIAEHAAKEAAYNHVVQLLDSTTADRAALTTFFITEKETITFISELEIIAKRLGVTVETTELAVVGKTGTAPGSLAVGLRFSGSPEQVTTFVTILENIPYHSSIPDLIISKSGAVANTVSGTIKLLITIKS